MVEPELGGAVLQGPDGVPICSDADEKQQTQTQKVFRSATAVVSLLIYIYLFFFCKKGQVNFFPTRRTVGLLDF